MAQFVWLQREFPWLGSGFIHAVAESYADHFAGQLASLGFTVATMRCGAGDSFHAAVAPALALPDYYGQNWDSLHDCFRDIELPHPFAIIWRDAEDFATTNPKVFGEATAMLTSEFETLSARSIQATLVITGEGPTFRRPDPSPN